MNDAYLKELFGLEGKVAVVTGGTGVLGGAMTKGLAALGAKVAIMGRNEERAAKAVAAVTEAGGEAITLLADVNSQSELIMACDKVLAQWGKVDILVNGAGGNVAAANVPDDASVFDVPKDAFSQVFDLNLMGTLLPSQVFGRAMVEQAKASGGKPEGSIINISSMAALRVISRVAGYSAAKAAVDNFTRWLAVELARKYGAGLRVNAIAPGFFIAEQNRALLTNPDGTLTARGTKVIEHTPAGRFGEPHELVSTLGWLCSPGAKFVTGLVVPVDGGFSIFSGV